MDLVFQPHHHIRVCFVLVLAYCLVLGTFLGTKLRAGVGDTSAGAAARAERVDLGVSARFDYALLAANCTFVFGIGH